MTARRAIAPRIVGRMASHHHLTTMRWRAERGGAFW